MSTSIMFDTLATKQDLKYQTLQLTVIFGSMLGIAIGILIALSHFPK